MKLSVEDIIHEVVHVLVIFLRKSPREKKNDKSKPDGSTRLPKWPVVKFQKPEIGLQKEINWGDVPKLR